MNPESQKILEQCQGTLEATAVYDALGLPAEMLTEAKIADQMPNVADEYLRCPPSHPSYDEHEAGHWSDDTQLSLAVQQAIIDRNGYIDMRAIAKMHVKAFRESIMGWGGATRESSARLAISGYNYSTSGKRGAVGNGVVMKMLPLALAMHYHSDFDDPKKRIAIIDEFTSMTHKSVVALVSSAVHAEMLEEVLTKSSEELKSKEGRLAFLSRALDLSKQFEAEFGEAQGLLSSRIKSLLDHFDSLSENGTLIKLSNGGGCFVPDTLAMCYGLLASNFSFKSARRAVLIGGDTDSNAAIVGSMAALVEPTNKIPQHLRDGVWRRDELLETSKNFAAALVRVRVGNLA